jgi:ABC transporter substrate binding protein
MTRREVVMLLGGAVVWPLTVNAQEPGRTYRLGGLTPSPRDGPHYNALFDELRRLGIVEGQNLTVDWRGYGFRIEQFPDIAAELVKAKVDVIYCAGDTATRAAQQATTTIPILAITDDMVGSGLVRSLAQPGGNTTGVSILGTELDGKRQDILIEAVPGLRRLAALADANQPRLPQYLQALEDGARARGAELLIYRITNSDEACPQSTPRRHRMPQRSTCCRRRSCSATVGSSSSGPRRCACQRCINGLKWPKRGASSRTVRASNRCFEMWHAASSSSYSAA